ncbi:hypothetical protein Tco_0867322 [Tanacetum coccineum]
MAFSEDGLSGRSSYARVMIELRADVELKDTIVVESVIWNVKNSSTSTTPIMDKIRKFENLIIDGEAILVDEAGNPLKKVEYLDDHDSEDEVASDDNDMAHSLALERTGFGT